MQRIGIFGGTFDPIHIGHLYVANAVLEQEQLERVLFVPVGEPAHRSTHAPAGDRKAMVGLAIENNAGFALDDTALRQAGPVYTADTLPLLKERYPDAALSFIAGADSLVRSTWRRLHEVVAALERFYVVAREHTAGEELQAVLARLPSDLARRFVVLNLPLVDVSASAIRASISQGRTMRYLLPDSVVQYIEARGLYRGNTSS